MSEKRLDKKPYWKIVEAGTYNHNPLIDDILKPIQEELSEVVRLEINALEKIIRRK